jgi:hypothetical protein
MDESGMTTRGAMEREPALERLSTGALVMVGALLLGYMFLGRGFAHLGLGPLYVGDWVLLVTLVMASLVAIRQRGVGVSASPIVLLLLIFGAWGAVRTIPYLERYGLDALRDGTLWGYAAFAIITYVLVDDRLGRSALRAYGYVVPIFALWLPISWNLAARLATDIDPNRPGDTIPLVFFKSGDMAVHIIGSIAFLVLAAPPARSLRSLLWMGAIAVPLWWTAFVAGTSNRGALLTIVAGVVAIAIAGIVIHRSRNWRPVAAAGGILAVVLGIQSVALSSASPRSEPASSATQAASLIASPSARASSPAPSRHGAQTSQPAASPEVSAGGTTGTTLIQNPDFEVGPANNGTVSGWSGGQGIEDTVAADAHRGRKSASLVNEVGPYRATLTSTRFSVDPGGDLEVSAWAKAIRGRPTLEVHVTWYDASGSQLGRSFVTLLRTNGSTEWQRCLGYATAPPKSSEAEITLFEATGGATIGIDDVRVRIGDFVAEPPAPSVPQGRPATLEQMLENVLSLFGSSSDGGLEGTKQFRLAWWGPIVDYTIFGDYFWTGKGFGVNLADADGFQSTADGSLRAPHNSHMTVLARMGVPGFVMWLLLQGAWIIGVVRASNSLRRNGEVALALLAACVAVYWMAMMINTSFDPYLEGPQGGIWFWTIFGLGMGMMKFARGTPPA